jgi:Flp pilus assembly protein TadB
MPEERGKKRCEEGEQTKKVLKQESQLKKLRRAWAIMVELCMLMVVVAPFLKKVLFVVYITLYIYLLCIYYVYIYLFSENMRNKENSMNVFTA